MSNLVRSHNSTLQRHQTTVTIRTNSTPSSSVREDSTLTSRPKTFLEKQPYIFGYGAAISLVSPAATAYQLCRLYNIRNTAPLQLLSMSASIFPQQTILKAAQMNASTPVKEHFNPWAAFAVVGILQGAVYGQANIHFSKVLGIGGNNKAVALSLAGLFRGSGFAACRDMLSQGLPFMCSHHVRTHVLDRYYPTSTTSANKDTAMLDSIKHWTSVLSTSILATYASQAVHNCSIAMQSNQTLGYASAVRSVFAQHGVAMLYRGAEARVGLLLLVNVLNEILLKPAWAPVPLCHDESEQQASSFSLLAAAQR